MSAETLAELQEIADELRCSCWFDMELDPDGPCPKCRLRDVIAELSNEAAA